MIGARTAVLENARAANGSLHVRWRYPVSCSDPPVPSHHWLARVGLNRASTDEGFGFALRRFDRAFSSRAMILASLRERSFLRSLCR